MYIVGADSAFDHDLEKALFNIKCNTLLLLLLLLLLGATRNIFYSFLRLKRQSGLARRTIRVQR